MANRLAIAASEKLLVRITTRPFCGFAESIPNPVRMIAIDNLYIPLPHGRGSESGSFKPDERPVEWNQNCQNEGLNHRQPKPDSKQVPPLKKTIRISHDQNGGLINKDLATDRECPNHAY